MKVIVVELTWLKMTELIHTKPARQPGVNILKLCHIQVSSPV